jgi:hypothetical protein
MQLLEKCSWDMAAGMNMDLSKKLPHLSRADSLRGRVWGLASWDFQKRKNGGRERSCHGLAKMMSNEKTPKRIGDGQFVFINKETCIGCT